MVGKSGRYMGVPLNDWVWYGGRSHGDTWGYINIMNNGSGSYICSRFTRLYLVVLCSTVLNSYSTYHLKAW